MEINHSWLDKGFSKKPGAEWEYVVLTLLLQSQYSSVGFITFSIWKYDSADAIEYMNKAVICLLQIYIFSLSVL